jgi:lauroyl/myristoyl acyltransferase
MIYFKKPSNDIYKINGVDVMHEEMENAINKSPAEYSWEYKKFRKLAQAPSDIYKD